MDDEEKSEVEVVPNPYRIDYSNNIEEKMSSEIQICFKPVEYRAEGNGAGRCTLLLTTETISNSQYD
mgnify:CR=1 FL=1